MNFSKGAHNKIYWKCLHVICSCFDAMALSEKDTKTRWGILGFIKCFAILNPNKMWSTWMQEFITMSGNTKTEATRNEKMKVYYSINEPEILENYIIECKSTSALEWSWALHEYINYKRRLNGEQILSLSFTDIQEKYNPKYVTKDFWGRPTWFVLHTFSLHLNPFNDYTKSVWKAFISSLQFVLPCPICRTHVKENMQKIKVDDYMSSPSKAFEWTWRLHNTVNLSKVYKSSAITVQEAKDIYLNSNDDTLMMIFL